MSFINLLANDVWSEQDIVNKTEAMVRSEFSVQAETILNRKVIGQLTGAYTMTEVEVAELDRYKTVVEQARIAGDEARADMKLLNQVFEFEVAANRLKRPVVEQIVVDQEVVNQAEIDADYAERQAAQEKLDTMPDDVRVLFDLRNPAPVEVPVVEVPVEPVIEPTPVEEPVVETPAEQPAVE
jgi:hypothetical protein